MVFQCLLQLLATRQFGCGTLQHLAVSGFSKIIKGRLFPALKKSTFAAFFPAFWSTLASSFHLHRKRFLSLFLASYLLLGPACCIFPERHPTWAFMTDIDRVLLIWLTIIPFSLSDPPPSLPSDKTWNLSLDAPFLIPPNTARRYFYQLKKLIGVYCTSLVSQSTHKS